MQMMEGHKARKRFGQNFLKDEYWIGRIAKAVDAEPGQAVVEIGPGQAALTRELIAGAGHVRAVEIDRDLAGWLKTQFTQQQLTLIEADALTLDWKKVAGNERLRVVGNLPYNISSPLLFHLMEAADVVIDQHFMLQREVVDLCMYHDQGLPVLKREGFGHGVNVTLGLPWIRTSVDHGTALDIAGKGIADAGSMTAALHLARRMAHRAQRL